MCQTPTSPRPSLPGHIGSHPHLCLGCKCLLLAAPNKGNQRFVYLLLMLCTAHKRCGHAQGASQIVLLLVGARGFAGHTHPQQWGLHLRRSVGCQGLHVTLIGSRSLLSIWQSFPLSQMCSLDSGFSSAAKGGVGLNLGILLEKKIQSSC